MNYQDWEPVILTKNKNKNENEKKYNNNKLSKLDANNDMSGVKKQLDSESVKELVSKRLEMKLTQEKADNLCAFSRNTFKDLESKKSLPTQSQQSVIQKKLGVQLKIN